MGAAEVGVTAFIYAGNIYFTLGLVCAAWAFVQVAIRPRAEFVEAITYAAFTVFAWPVLIKSLYDESRRPRI